MREVGLKLACFETSLGLFETLIHFIGENSGVLTRRSLPCQMFAMATSALAISRANGDLQSIRSFAKRILAHDGIAKDDLRAVLCRSLLSEIVAVEQQLLVEADMFPVEECETSPSERPVEEVTVDRLNGVDILRLIDGLSHQETKAEALRRLIDLDDRFPLERIAETVAGLDSSIQKDIEAIERRPLAGRNSDIGTTMTLKSTVESGGRHRGLHREG
jgi:hypothetical protein